METDRHAEDAGQQLTPKPAAPGFRGARDPDLQQVKGPLYRSWVLPSWYMSIDRGIERRCGIDTHIKMEYYSAITKNEIMPFAATWMDLEIIILNEVSQRKTNIMMSRICGI